MNKIKDTYTDAYAQDILIDLLFTTDDNKCKISLNKIISNQDI